MKRFVGSLSYGILDQVVARVFDLGSLWVVMRALPEADLAAYGVATAMLFIFNLLLLVPENALMRDKKKWAEQGELPAYLAGFLLFAQLRIGIVALIALGTGGVCGWNSAYFYACLFALAAQLIQLAELARLDFRIDLQQRQVFQVELLFKALLLCVLLVLFVYPGLLVYLGAYVGWAAVCSFYWSSRLRRKHHLGLRLPWADLRRAVQALRDFSFWQHLSGVVTYVIYNIDPWVLTWFAVATGAVSTYTLALKVSALFFAIPMFLQSMTTIFLVNCRSNDDKHRTFRRMFALNAGIALAQMLVFLVFGEQLGRIFRGGSLDLPAFYEIGVVLSVGILILNLARPLLSDLVLHAPMQHLLLRAYLPTLLFALASYVGLTAVWGPLGCAIASAASYGLFALLLAGQSMHFGVARAALWSTSPLARHKDIRS